MAKQIAATALRTLVQQTGKSEAQIIAMLRKAAGLPVRKGKTQRRARPNPGAGFVPSFRPGDRVEIAPHFDLWMRGDRYGDVVKHSQRFGVYVKMDKSGKTLRFRPDDLTRINAPRRRTRRNPGYRKSETQAWREVRVTAQGIRKASRDGAVYNNADFLVDLADRMLSQLAAGVHENPALGILGNPPRAAVLGTLSRRVHDIRYQHAQGKRRHWRHAFRPGVHAVALKDGTILIRHPDGQPVVQDFPDYHE